MSKSTETLVENLVAVLKTVYGDKPATRSVVEAVVESWYNDIDDKVKALIVDWEDRIPDDTTLYTLGARRALDMFRGDETE